MFAGTHRRGEQVMPRRRMIGQRAAAALAQLEFHGPLWRDQLDGVSEITLGRLHYLELVRMGRPRMGEYSKGRGYLYSITDDGRAELSRYRVAQERKRERDQAGKDKL